jgi:hypothetical protein
MIDLKTKVDDLSFKIINILNDVDLLKINDVNENLFKTKLIDNLYINFLKNSEFEITEDFLNCLIKETIVEDAINSLKEKNLIDSYFENGKEYFYPTKNHIDQ